MKKGFPQIIKNINLVTVLRDGRTLQSVSKVEILVLGRNLLEKHIFLMTLYQGRKLKEFEVLAVYNEEWCLQVTFLIKECPLYCMCHLQRREKRKKKNKIGKEKPMVKAKLVPSPIIVSH